MLQHVGRFHTLIAGSVSKGMLDMLDGQIVMWLDTEFRKNAKKGAWRDLKEIFWMLGYLTATGFTTAGYKELRLHINVFTATNGRFSTVLTQPVSSSIVGTNSCSCMRSCSH